MKMVRVEIPEHIVQATCRQVGKAKGERYITYDFAVQYALEHWVDNKIDSAGWSDGHHQASRPFDDGQGQQRR